MVEIICFLKVLPTIHIILKAYSFYGFAELFRPFLWQFFAGIIDIYLYRSFQITLLFKCNLLLLIYRISTYRVEEWNEETWRVWHKFPVSFTLLLLHSKGGLKPQSAHVVLSKCAYTIEFRSSRLYTKICTFGFSVTFCENRLLYDYNVIFISLFLVNLQRHISYEWTK